MFYLLFIYKKSRKKSDLNEWLAHEHGAYIFKPFKWQSNINKSTIRYNARYKPAQDIKGHGIFYILRKKVINGSRLKTII